MKFQISHTSRYDYDEDVSVSYHIARVTPRTLPWQRCATQAVTTEPTRAAVAQRPDYFGNLVTWLTVPQPHRQLTIHATSTVELEAPPLVAADATPAWGTVAGGDLAAADRLAAQEFVFESPLIALTPEIYAYAAASFPAGRPILEGALDLTERIHREFTFDPLATTVATPLKEVCRTRRGVCQDFAHFQVACLRALGLPARYVSGYLQTTPPESGERLVGADASHAWVAVYCGAAGWADLDPTNNLRPGSQHITVAWGRDYSDVSPIRGVIHGGGAHWLQVGVDVAPLPG